MFVFRLCFVRFFVCPFVYWFVSMFSCAFFRLFVYIFVMCLSSSYLVYLCMFVRFCFACLLLCLWRQNVTRARFLYLPAFFTTPVLLQLADLEKQQLLKQQQSRNATKGVRELERINRVSRNTVC